MDKLNLLLIGSSADFAAIFGEVAGGALSEARSDASGRKQGATMAAGVEFANRSGLDGTREARQVPSPASEASDPTFDSHREV